MLYNIVYVDAKTLFSPSSFLKKILVISEVAVIASDKNKMGYVTKQDTQRGWNARLPLS